VQVDKLEQSDAVRSEEEAKATDKPLVFSKNILLTLLMCLFKGVNLWLKFIDILLIHET